MAAVLEEELSENNGGSSQYSKVIELAKLTLKVAILINGVAAISLLALLGNIITNHVCDVSVNLLVVAILIFGSGVLSAAIAVAMGYKSEHNYFHQNRYFNRLSGNEEILADIKEKIKSECQRLGESSERHLNYAVWLVYASYSFFGIGLVLCTLAFLI